MKKQPPAVSPPAHPAATTVSSGVVLAYQIRGQQARTLRTAEQLLGELEGFVQRLREGSVPTATINASTFAFLVADHAKLVTLQDTLEMLEKS